MIKLIPCNDRDMSMYYHNTILYDAERKQFVLVLGIDNRSACVRESDGSDYITSPSNLFVHIPTVQYTSSGYLVGIRCQRSYKRGLEASDDVLETLAALNETDSSSFNNTSGGRIGKVFYVKPFRNILFVEYKGEPCGLFKDDTFYLRDSILAERLKEFVDGDYHVMVQ